jgi:nicotinate-nucleotide adenylyltransferase
MLKLVFNDEIFEINTLENKKRYKGTYWALNELKETHKSDVYFVMGADNIEQLDKWINYEKLISEHNFIVLTREGYDPVKLIKEKFPENVKNFSVVEYHSEISSRKYRENTTLEHFLNEKVVSYIKGHNLYGGNDVKA